MPVENRRKHLKSVGIDVLFNVTNHRHLVTHQDNRQFGRRLHRQSTDTRLQGLILRLADRQSTRLELPVIFFSQLENVRMIDITNDHHVGVVRHIPALIPVPRILHGHVFEIIHPADDRHAVRVRLKSDTAHLLEKHRLRLVVGTQPALLHNDLYFLCKLLGVEVQVTHAIRFEPHHFFQLLLRYLLKIGGVVMAGKSVVTPAGSRHKAIELAWPGSRCPLEHHVLKQMGNAGRAVGLVDTAGPVPDHMRCSRRPTVFLDDDAQPVGQLMFEGIGQRRQRRSQGEQKQSQSCVAHGQESLLLEFAGERIKISICDGILPSPQAPERPSDSEVPCLVS